MNALVSLALAGLRGRRRSSTIAVVVVIALAAIGIVAGLAVGDQGATRLDAVAAEARVADLVVFGPDDVLAEVARDREVVDSSGPFEVTGASLLFPDGDDLDVRLTAIADPAIEVGRPVLRSGSWFGADDEVVLDHSLAIDAGYDVGDPVQLVRADAGTTVTVTATVAGTAVDLTDCFMPDCDPGRIYVPPVLLARLSPDAGSILLVRLTSPDRADPVAARILAEYPGLGSTESWLDTRDDTLTRDRIFGAFIASFGAFVLVAACVVVASTMTARMAARRREIGLFKAVGVSPAGVVLVLVIEHLVLGLLGAVLGWLAGSALAPGLAIGVTEVLGSGGHAFDVGRLAIVVMAVSVLLVLATLASAVRSARVPATDVLLDVPPSSRWSVLTSGGRLGPTLGLGVHDATARPTRSLLAAAAVGLAVAGTVASIGFIDTIDHALADPAVVGDPWDAVVIPLDGRSAEAVGGDVDAVPQAAGWFTVQERRATAQERAFLSRAIGGDPAAARYEIGEGRLPVAAGEAIAGYGLLDAFGLEIGDSFSFNAGATPLETTIVGWYREAEDSGEILTYRIETLQAVDPAASGDDLFVVAADGVDRDELVGALTERLGPNVRVDTLDTEADEFTPFKTVLWVLSVLVAVVALANLTGTVMASARERARDLGVLRTVGFTTGQLLGASMLGGAVIGAVGALAGSVVGRWVFIELSDVTAEAMGTGPGFGRIPSWSTLAAMIPVGATLGGIIGAVGVWQLSRLAVADLVRYE